MQTISLKESENYYLIKRISAKTGISIKKLLRELDLRTKLLVKITKQDISDFEEFVIIIKQYYEDSKMVFKKFKIKTE